MLIARFEAHAEAAPDAIAVVTNDGETSYGELDNDADALAARLFAAGVGRGDVAAVLCARGRGFVTALVAILKAGAAYLPLDATYPAERLAFMVAKAGAAIAVTDRRHAASVPSSVRALLVDDAVDGAAAATTTRVQSDLSDLAYVMFTSGSTGRPKGVGVRLSSIESLVVDTDYVRLTPETVVGQAANAAFDALTFEVWGALLNGGTLRILDTEVPQAIAPRLLATAAGRPTALFLTTVLFNRLVRSAPGPLAKVSDVLFGGELADPRAVRACVDRGDTHRVVHVYGPTETTTFATWWEVDVAALDERPDCVPIGRAVRGAFTRVIGEDGRPARAGEVGELYVGGAGVGVGYVGEPELTAERFVDDPVADGGTVFRTGDLVRVDADGLIDVVGRADDQVKVRGFRIELAEVEAAFRRDPSVSEVAAVAPASENGERELVVYVVLSTAEPADVAKASLLAAAREWLPPFMAPRRVHIVEALPTTPNGKVDKARLLAP